MRTTSFLISAFLFLNSAAIAAKPFLPLIRPSAQLTSAIAQVADGIFEWHEEDEKKAWLEEMFAQANKLYYTECLAEQVLAIDEVKDKLFDWHELEERSQWVKNQVNNILYTPICDCRIHEDIRTIARQKNQLYKWHQEEEGKTWARKHIAALL